MSTRQQLAESKLRDQFAESAMQAILSTSDAGQVFSESPRAIESIAAIAYMMADAMMKQRRAP